ncbi:plant UBX domain-containing protein 2 isoform X2 [Jatropha curcas]|uniref:plant UBX domain-containing protein 2 isoform X2 n=1 Tax=Jatropha curcas TaxID=180498 RepID=UPI0009D66813|nr:plant UBX domain-containing protein 2 isoform X2 [Jatropha curcas]
MGDMKDKFKGFMKKVNTQLQSSSSGKFKGQGRVLGGGSGSSSSSGPVNPIHTRYSQPVNPKPTPDPPSLNSTSNCKPLPQKTTNFEQIKPDSVNNPTPNRNSGGGFDPFDSLITTVDGENELVESSGKSELQASVVDAYLSGKTPDGSVQVVLRLFTNIVKEPDNAKFRKIRMGNPKIREAITEVAGGIELLEFVGFELKEDGGEMWAVLEVPDEERIRLINKVIELLEPKPVKDEASKIQDKPSVASAGTKEQVEPKKIDRQIRVFFSVPESVAAKIELPDSFYYLSIDEVKREADARKKKIAESQLLIPKSYREKQAKAARKRYKRTLIRIQFPDGVVLQGVFAPWEQTTALYEFVSSSLKDPSLEFELLDPVLVKRRVIPHFPEAGQRASTLEDEDLVPSALIKFRPLETDSSVFTGLCNELLQISEPLN